jgi:translation initiation factor IF-2
MNGSNKPMMAGLIAAVALLAVVAGVIAQRALAPPRLTYPSGQGGAAGGPSVAAGAPGRGPQGGGMARPGGRFGPASYSPGGMRPPGSGGLGGSTGYGPGAVGGYGSGGR